jgi:putative ABC transport system permease protein
MEVVIRIKDLEQLEPVYQQLAEALNARIPGQMGQGQMGQGQQGQGQMGQGQPGQGQMGQGQMGQGQMGQGMGQGQMGMGQMGLEIHTWDKLVPFTNIVRIVELLITMIRVFLVAIVLVSIMNVMIMSVYERISEIGTIASIGTSPGRIRWLFLAEGLSLGLLSSFIGALLGMGVLQILTITKVNMTWGRTQMALAPKVSFEEILLTIGIVVAISVLSSLQPAFKASRLEPVEALRHV